ncbi:MAG TPA: acylphosphatase [Candidatus Limnocylindrales bacterium]|nr:acylphosphatase [Candidatus Limnocylindrales bacterium]
MSDVERLEARIEGTVQGVGFRWFVVRHAEQLGLGGWVANESDGSVRVVAEGSPERLDRLEGLLRDGPRGARVRAVHAQRLPASGRLDGFHVRASGHRGD